MEVGNHPVLFSKLNRAGFKRKEFTASQSTTNQKSNDGVIAFAPETIALRFQQQRAALVGSEPVSQSHADAAYAFYAADAGGKFWTEQAGIRCLVCHTPDRGQAEVDRCRSKASLFEVDSVSSTTVRLKASRGSEQYKSTNLLLA
jgi:hypothetical protein